MLFRSGFLFRYIDGEQLGSKKITNLDSEDPFETRTSVHAYNRPEYNGEGWFKVAIDMLEKVKEYGGVLPRVRRTDAANVANSGDDWIGRRGKEIRRSRFYARAFWWITSS